MKTLYASALVLFITLTFSVNTISAQEKENKIVATFKGVTETEYFKFVDEKDATILFYDLDENIELSLYEEEMIGKKFNITWSTKQIDEFDENGEATGDLTTVKTILTITEVK
ncbi:MULTISPECIES: hypothetical protein [unclassified Polaribacter]|uniref:hypothetical protein n=1 Tax=unclassified Polaribacter TaxID=196858 RepID=UPI001C4F9ECB|nr:MULTISPECIES: hypothetical protein [unclassified Polaribacter]QXP63809.1 hypothetical protein H0I27_00995 [Polaribacter sp. HaHaR_3_91]QXP66311.1 hypothetical protein H0I28_14150 [Polaribacter sp. AHE13PA]